MKRVERQYHDVESKKSADELKVSQSSRRGLVLLWGEASMVD